MSDPDPPRDRTSGNRAKRALVVAAFAWILGVAPVWAQGPTTAATSPISTSGQPIDPTKNVLDTLQAAVTRLNDVIASYIKRLDDLRDIESKFQSALRAADAQRLTDLREADTRRLNEMREAETRRLDQLAAQKQVFDLELARVIRSNVEASTLLLATQVKELKTDSSERTAKLEQFANEQRGRTSATDPANVKISDEVRLLSHARSLSSGNDTGQSNVVFYLIAAVMALLALGSLILSLVVAFGRHSSPQPYPYPPPNGYPTTNGYPPPPVNGHA